MNRLLGTPVSTGGRPSRKGMFWDVFWRWQPTWLNGPIVEGCSKEKKRKSWRPSCQCWSWSQGPTEWFFCLISVNVMEEKWQSRSEDKRVGPHEEPRRSASRSWNGLYVLLVANEGSAAVEHCKYMVVTLWPHEPGGSKYVGSLLRSVSAIPDKRRWALVHCNDVV